MISLNPCITIESGSVATKKRFGKIVKTLKPGLHFGIPFVHSFTKYNATEHPLDWPVFTILSGSDPDPERKGDPLAKQIQINIDLKVVILVVHAENLENNIGYEDMKKNLEAAVKDVLIREFSKRSFYEIQKDWKPEKKEPDKTKKGIEEQIKEEIFKLIHPKKSTPNKNISDKKTIEDLGEEKKYEEKKDWGIKLVKINREKFEPADEDLRKELDNVATTEFKKQSQIIEAEAKLAAKLKEIEGREAEIKKLAEAEKEAVKKKMRAEIYEIKRLKKILEHEGDFTDTYLIRRAQVALEKIGVSDNTVILPAELSSLTSLTTAAKSVLNQVKGGKENEV